MKANLLTALTLCAAATACVKPGQMDSSGRSSKLVSVKMKMPTKIGDKDITGKMDGYHLSVKKTGGDCVFTDIDRTEKISASDVKLDATLKQGCDYALMLSFGKVASDGKKMDQIFLSSEAYDDKPAAPTFVKKEELKGKSSITIKACVAVTSLGAKELGVNVMECPSVADDSVDTTVEPYVPQPTGTFKISKDITYNVQTSALVVSGELTSSATKTMYCALAVEAQFLGSSMKREILDDAVTEVKPSDKRTIDKTIDIKDIVDKGPYQISEVRVIEACQDTKPDASTTGTTMIAKCVEAKNCAVVKR